MQTHSQEPRISFPVAQFDLLDEIRLLRTSPSPHGHVAKTILHNRDLSVVLMALSRGTRIPQHRTKGSLAILVLDGRAVVTLLQTSFDLGVGRLLAIDPETEHALVAIDDTALMLTVSRARTG